MKTTRILMLLAAVAVFAGAALAETPTYDRMMPIEREPIYYEPASYSTGQYLDNPCTTVQDYVWVDYSAYAEAAQAEVGVSRFLVREDTTMSGTTYRAAGTSTSDVAYTSAFSIRQYHKVNTYDNFHVVTVVTFTPSSGYTTLKMETACGNGMPDSKE